MEVRQHSNIRAPGFALICVTDCKNDLFYANLKQNACEETGIKFYMEQLSESTTTEQLINTIQKYNELSYIDGLFLQLPIPCHIDQIRSRQSISLDKDIDGLTLPSLGQLSLLESSFQTYNYPCIALAVYELLSHFQADLPHSHIVILGTNDLCRQILLLLLKHGATQISLYSPSTPNLPHLTRQAQIVIVNISSPEYITSEHISPNTLVVDLGQNLIEDGTAKRGWRVKGDVNRESLLEVTKWVNPVPGIMGPLTIAMLLRNTLERSKMSQKSKM